MPLINVITSKEDFDDSDGLLQEISRALSSLTGKPEKYVMTTLQTKVPMTFAGTTEPCCYVEVKSIGAIDSSKMSSAITKIIAVKLNIPSNRIYISFEDIAARMWGWDGKTFG